MIDKLPPHSIEAEQGALGCILSSEDCLDQWFEKTGKRQEVFYDVKHQEIFRACADLFEKRSGIDTVTVYQRLKESGSSVPIAYVSTLPDATPSAANFSHYMGILFEKYQLRSLIKTGQDLIDRAHNESGNPESLRAQAEVEITAQEITACEVYDSKRSAHAMMNDLESRMALKGRLTGIPSGIRHLDSVTSGFQFKEQAIIGARPSTGKTALALKCLSYACFESRVPTLFVSLEMSAEAILRRLLAAHAFIPMNDIKNGVLNDRDLMKIQKFNELLLKAPLYIVDGLRGMTEQEIASVIRRHVRKFGVQFVLVDYLQKVTPSRKSEKRTYEVATVSSALKFAAHSNKVALLTLAQLNRESDKDKGRTPRLSDLADSAQIERDADFVGLLHRPRTEEDPDGRDATLFVAKQRDGELAAVKMKFEGKYCQFENPSPITPDDYPK